LVFNYDFGGTSTNVDNVLAAIKETFYISPVLLLVPALLIFVIARKVPPLPSLIFGTLIGAVFAIIFQPHIIHEVSETTGSFFKQSYIAVMKTMFGSVSVTTDNASVNELLSTRGMAGMLNTIWLIITAMVFGGIMEAAGMLAKITQYIMKMVHNAGSLVGSTVATCIFFNITASDQYLSIVVPGRMFAKPTATWVSNPSFSAGRLRTPERLPPYLYHGIHAGQHSHQYWEYRSGHMLPYAFFNLISPFMSIFMAAFNIKIRRFSDDPTPEHPHTDESVATYNMKQEPGNLKPGSFFSALNPETFSEFLYLAGIASCIIP
jgi:Na+:H+ antiporter, NhaC family